MPIYLLVPFLISSLYVFSCAYLIRGGCPLLFLWYTPPDDGKDHQLPGCRLIACALSTLMFAAWIVLLHLNPWLILVYPIGWYLTIMPGWGDYFDCQTFTHVVMMFGRMLMGVCLFVPLALLSPTSNHVWHGYMIGWAYSVVFSLGATLAYTLYGNLFSTAYRSNPAYPDWAEAITGVLIGALPMLLVYA